MKKFWNWQNQADTDPSAERVLELNGTIAEDSWFDDDVAPAMFKEELFRGNGPVTIWINSPGGDCIAASQIYAMLMDYKGEVTVKIDSIAASAASVIAMAGTKVLMAPTALMMIHNPATAAFGDHADMAKTIDMLSEVKESIINAYAIKIASYSQQMDELQERQRKLKATAGRFAEVKYWMDALKEHIHSDEKMDTGDAVMLRQLTDRIIVYDDRLEIHLRIGVALEKTYKY